MSSAREPRLFLREVSELDADHLLASFESDGALRFDAGQWINLQVQPDGAERDARALSFASAPRELPRVELCVRRKTGSRAIQTLQDAAPGREFCYDGPYGAFRRRGPFAERNLFVASSTGVAALRSLFADTTASDVCEVEARLLHCPGHDAKPVFHHEWAEWRRRWPSLGIEAVDPGPGDEASLECWRPLLEQMRECLKAWKGQACRVWMVGHSTWIKPMRAELREGWGFDRKQVKAEIFWS